MTARIIVALLAGTLFGIGLALAGMVDPVRVRGFLDVGGQWDPTLAFVLGGALVPVALAWRVRWRMERPLVAERFDLPKPGRIDARLISGAALFGVGWGVGGLCPGPAIADLALRPLEAGVFVTAMLCGFALARLLARDGHPTRSDIFANQRS